MKSFRILAIVSVVFILGAFLVGNQMGREDALYYLIESDNHYRQLYKEEVDANQELLESIQEWKKAEKEWTQAYNQCMTAYENVRN